MRPNRPKLRDIAAWLGFLALGLNALVPVHLAFDLAHTLAPADHESGSDHDLLGCLLSVVAGHHHDDDHGPAGKTDHEHGCAVCAASAILAGAALPAVAVLTAPMPVYAPKLGLADFASPPAAFAAAYHPRAPPVA
jgi:hypothetical protein